MALGDGVTLVANNGTDSFVVPAGDTYMVTQFMATISTGVTTGTFEVTPNGGASEDVINLNFHSTSRWNGEPFSAGGNATIAEKMKYVLEPGSTLLIDSNGAALGLSATLMQIVD